MAYMTKRKQHPDYWQLSARAAFDGERRGILLDVCHPTMGIYKQVILWGDEGPNGSGQPRLFAERCASRLERKLKDQGISIPDARKRIADLIEGKWFG
jgi:hypothetical protein